MNQSTTDSRDGMDLELCVIDVGKILYRFPAQKIMTKNFKQFLLSIHQQPMQKQQELLNENIVAWMGNSHPQVDDILVMGIRFLN